jgi:hypothetical protein
MCFKATRWDEYRGKGGMKDIAHVRVFRHKWRLRATFALLSIATLAAALLCTYIAVTADSETEYLVAIMLAPSGVFALFFTYVLFRLQVKILVDQDSICSTGLFRSIRIPFSEVTECHSNRSHLRIRSRKHRVAADSWIDDIRALSELVERRLQEVRATETSTSGGNAREQTVFRYARGFKWSARFILADLIFVAVIGLLVRPDEFQWGWVVLFIAPVVVGIPVAAYVLYRTKTTVEFLDEFLCWQRGTRTVTVPYETIEQAVVKKTWNGFQYLDICYKGRRLCLSGALVPFDRLIALLSQRTSIAWTGAWPLGFPVVMKGSSALEQLVGVIGGLLFGALSLYLVVDPTHSDWFTFAIGVVGGLFGIGFVVSGTLLQFTYDSPRRLQIRRRKIVFGKRRFVIVDLCRCHTYRARDVTDVYLRVDNSFSTTYVLEISLGERRFVFQNFGHDVPLLPLYQLLCLAYYPEGYRNPVALEGEDRQSM